jgi:hypothetical protein
MRCFARATHCQISDGDNRHIKRMLFQNSPIKEAVADCGQAAINQRKNIKNNIFAGL